MATVAAVPTALLSVYDKAGIGDLAEALHGLGWRIVSSGGTAKAVAERGVPVTDVAELTGVPAILDHRVVTLHPKVHGGLLADPTKPEHQADMEAYGIEPISLVVVNLYPFTSSPGIELIDIGGPAMVRASAKNHAHVAIVVDPDDYDVVLSEIEEHGEVTLATRRRLARDAFAHTAAYDAAIVSWFDASEPDPEPLPRTIHVALERAELLRYGENPHQQGARYRFAGAHGWWDSMVQHGGKDLSYLNLYDTEAAWRLVNDFEAPACVIVKHANPCGVAVADDVTEAYARANACDPVSAFGGIVAVNRTVTPRDGGRARRRVHRGRGRTRLRRRRARRVARQEEHARDHRQRCRASGCSTSSRSMAASSSSSPTRCRSTGRRGGSSPRSQPTASQWGDLVFAWQVCAAVSSNAIVYAKDLQAFGIGAGQQNRLDSARIAAERSAGRAAGGVCASDAFFPFRDGLDAAAAAGIAAVIQPGGSVRDDEVIAAANEHGIAMVFTGERHFRH